MNTLRKLQKAIGLARSTLRNAATQLPGEPRGMVGPRSLVRRLRLLSLDYVEVTVTKACNLKCHSCRHLMPYYDKARNYPIENVIRDMDALLGCARRIAMLRILGGEPFLHPHLDQLLRHLGANPKIGSLRIVTNGTLVPKPRLLEAMAAMRVAVDISDYGATSRRLPALTEALAAHGIGYEIVGQDWLEFGKPMVRPYSEQELSDIFFKCTTMPHKCYIVSDGRFHLCARSANAAELGIVQSRATDFVDLIATPSAEIPAAIRRLIVRSDHIEACRTCEKTFVRTEVASQAPVGRPT